MAITTLNKIKTVLGITSTAQDAQITGMIPAIEEDYLTIRNKPFDVATKVTFSDPSTSGGILDFSIGDGDLTYDYEVEFEAGDTVGIIARKTRNQILPNPYYAIVPTTNAVYFTEKHETLTNDISVIDLAVESTSVTTTVNKMQTIYPTGSEYTAAKMVQFNLGSSPGVQSESLGDHSISYGPTNGQYPQQITAGIRKYVSFV